MDSVARRFSLTPREADVLRQLSAGRTNRAIAVALECAERTVETHVRRILAKTDCASRSELVALIWRTVSPT
ncbi:MAG: helix-turn-helix transcriptional regulator [Deltaproteobacteria bacterium]|nr:helix-turn-helix transcriptional regulator [Deltaproteobacteria bacterium]